MSLLNIPAGITSFGFPAPTVPGVQSADAPSPWTSPLEWNQVQFSGGAFVWNGKIKFRNAKRSYNWQVKAPPGVQGEVDTYRGLHTKPFQMLLEIWDEAQWAKLPQLVDFLTYNATKPGPNGPASPIDIYHPSLLVVSISQVIVLDIGAPEVDQERTGNVSIAIELREFRPAPAVNVTATPTATQVPIVVLNRAGGSTGATIAAQQQAIQDEAADLPTTLP